jgi:hypothetical protein
LFRYVLTNPTERTKLDNDSFLNMKKEVIDYRKERANAWLPLVQEVKKDMQSGLLKAWGSYLGEMRGFGLAEGSEEAVFKMAQKYLPHVHFTTHPAATVDQMEKLFKEMAK